MGRLRTGAVIWRVVRRGGANEKLPFARITLHRHGSPDGAVRKTEREIVRPDGKTVTVAFAREIARAWQSRYDDGLWSPDDRTAPTVAVPPTTTTPTTVGTWVTDWLDRQVAREAYSEVLRDRERFRLWIAPTEFAALPLAKVTPRDAARLIEKLRAAKSPKTGERLAPRTVRNVIDPVSRALRSAVFEGELVADPFASLPTEFRPKAVDAHPERRRDYRLSRTAVETLLGDVGVEDRWLVLWHMLFLTGARVSEAIALRWCDRDARTPLRAITIAEQVHHRTRERGPIKSRDVRVVPEHPLLGAVLEWWRVNGWVQEYGRAPAADDLIVPSRGRPGRPWKACDGPGGPLWQQAVWDAMQRDLEGAGLPRHRVHDARHTLISLCSDAGVAANVGERWTHTAGGRSARHLYDAPSWDRQCAEMSKIVLCPSTAARWTTESAVPR